MRKKLGKIIIFTLIPLVLTFTLCACGSEDKAPAERENQSVSQNQTDLNPQSDQGGGEPTVVNGQTEETVMEGKTDEKIKGKIEENGEAKPESEKPAPEDDSSKTDTGLLTIEGSGMKEKVQFSLSNIKTMTSGYIEDDFFSLNNWGTKEYFSFKGVSLWYLLSEQAGLGNNAQTVTITAEDGYEVSYTIEEVKRQDYINEENPEQKYPMIIAWEENGKVYDPAEGYPFRFVVGQKEAGDINKQYWVMNVKTIKVE